MRTAALIACGLLAATVLPAFAQPMKPGLWEIHNRMQGGQMDQAMAEMQKQMAQMSPQQRKQMEQAMAQQGVGMAAAGGGGMQMCMTKEMAERNDVPMQGDCRTTQNQRAGNVQKFAFTCTNPPSSGEGEVTFHGPEAYSTRMTVKSAAGGRMETTTMEGSGKWLKADCGSVKPMPMPMPKK